MNTKREPLLAGRVTLVTGSGRGIGRSIAEHFASEGATVYANVRESSAIEGLIDKTYSQGKIIPCFFDVRDRDEVKKTFMEIKKAEGRLDCLVNNAGILVDTLLTMLDSKTLRDIYDVNVFAVFDLMAYAARIMSRQDGGGAIINIASICGDEGGMRGQSAYSSSKGAVIALTKTAAKELGEFNIRVNSVSPGFIDTDMFRSGPVAVQDSLVNGVYLGRRAGLSEEVANVCVFLASGMSSYVTGENIRVDGFAHI